MRVRVHVCAHTHVCSRASLGSFGFVFEIIYLWGLCGSAWLHRDV